MAQSKSNNDFLIRVKILLIVFISGISSLCAQDVPDDNGSVADQDKMPLNTFTVGIGRASELLSGGSFSNIGFDYLRRIHPKWELGVQLDIDWQRDFVEFEGVQVALIAAYSVTQKWPVFAGFGIAGEEDGHKEGFFRVGTEYTFFMGKKEMFFIAPGAFMDVTTSDVTPSVMLALGINW